MKIINHYILKYFFRYLSICLAVLIFIYVVINLFDNLGKFLAKNATAIDIIIYYFYLIPSYIVLLIPVAAIMAVFFVFGVMTKNRELIALKISGLNINRLFSLILITGIVLSIFTFVFQETVGVWAQTKTFEHKREHIDKQPRRSSTHRRKFFYSGEGDWVYFIKNFDAEKSTMNDIILWEITKDNRIKKRIGTRVFTFFVMISETQSLEGITSQVVGRDGYHYPLFDIEKHGGILPLEVVERELGKIQVSYGLSNFYIRSDRQGSYRPFCFSEVKLTDYMRMQLDLIDVGILDWNFFWWMVNKGYAKSRISQKKNRLEQRLVSTLHSYSVPILDRFEFAFYDTGVEKRGLTVFLGEKGKIIFGD